MDVTDMMRKRKRMGKAVELINELRKERGTAVVGSRE
jgi:hypothetical protein